MQVIGQNPLTLQTSPKASLPPGPPLYSLLWKSLKPDWVYCCGLSYYFLSDMAIEWLYQCTETVLFIWCTGPSRVCLHHLWRNCNRRGCLSICTVYSIVQKWNHPCIVICVRHCALEQRKQQTLQVWMIMTRVAKRLKRYSKRKLVSTWCQFCFCCGGGDGGHGLPGQLIVTMTVTSLMSFSMHWYQWQQTCTFNKSQLITPSFCMTGSLQDYIWLMIFIWDDCDPGQWCRAWCTYK